jgi:uncharacterized protein YjbJ (UPF0337 family)
MTVSGNSSKRMMSMNEDILKGKCQEIKGRLQEEWGKLIDNDLAEIEGKSEKLLGLLRKKYGYIRDKSELEYKDSVELAEIVSSIRGLLTKMKDIRAIAFIALYGRPLFAKNRTSQMTGKDEKHGNDTDRYFDTRLGRRNTHLAPQ